VPSLDESFLALPLTTLADAALQRARDEGAAQADVRVERTRSGMLGLRDGALETATDRQDVGIGVRVVVDGTWGFASTAELTADAAARTAAAAVRVARVSKPLSTREVTLAAEPVHADATWVGSYDVNPFEVPESDRLALMVVYSQRLMATDGISHVSAVVRYVQENKFYADAAGTRTTQQRVRIEPEFTAIAVDPAAGAFETMRTLAPPVGRGWEYLTGTGWDFDTELAELPAHLAEKMKAPSVVAGRYDLVVDPSNLWLTIHESIGHATELDRALGYEAAYAGTSFATPDQLGSLRYGSDVMNIVGDRTVQYGLATVGYDDEGVEAQSFDIVRAGTLVGYQTNREMAAMDGQRSNGCGFADSAGHIPLQRMANVSLQAQADGPSTAELISGVDNGLYVIGDKSWSIDMQRYNFQFTAQRFFKIEAGKVVGQVRDAAYQARTPDFWGSMEAVGEPSTYVLGGSFNCGKGQPGQVAPVSHGCPAALFRGVNILNTVQEGGAA
jgi:TldD protein